MDNDLIFESFRNCITDKKCKGCEWAACKILQNRSVGIPVDLGLAVTALMADLLKEREIDWKKLLVDDFEKHLHGET